jgi:uncharacterized protein YecE (DUF72 family)
MGRVYAGTSGWAYKTWSPDFYPKSVKAASYLNHYSSKLNAVEVNYTFRRRLTEQVQEKWLASTADGFLFSVKAPQAITHFKRLKDCEEYLKGFLESVQLLAGARRLGPLLFQLPPDFKADAGLLREFLQQIPRAARVTLEFRNSSWFAEPVYDILRAANAALCMAESEERATPEILTADFYYTRLRKPDYSADEVDTISARLGGLAARGDVFAFFKHEETAQGALNAMKVLEKIQSQAAGKAG